MKMLLIAAATLVVVWPTLRSPAQAETVIDRVLGNGERQDDRDRQDVERNRDQNDRAREEGRREGASDARQEHREMNGEDGRLDRDRRDLSGSSHKPQEGRHDGD